MKYILVNYNFDPTEILSYTDDFLIFDRSDDGKDWCKGLPKDKVIRTKNVGHCDFDKLSYLVDYYDQLPEVFLLGKTNLFKYIEREEFEKAKNSTEFVPLLTQHHKTKRSDGTLEYIRIHGTDKDICFYENNMFHEFNNSWYLGEYPAKHFMSYHQFASYFMLKDPVYIPFAPGGNYILTRDRIHRYSRDFYAEMASFLPYCQLPGEAYMVERSYYNIWK